MYKFFSKNQTARYIPPELANIIIEYNVPSKYDKPLVMIKHPYQYNYFGSEPFLKNNINGLHGLNVNQHVKYINSFVIRRELLQKTIIEKQRFDKICDIIAPVILLSILISSFTIFLTGYNIAISIILGVIIVFEMLLSVIFYIKSLKKMSRLVI